MTNSFSGSHPYRPQCVVSAVVTDWAIAFHDLSADEVRVGAERITAEITERIDAGLCPRCRGQLPDGNPVTPSGSRVTGCRCVPICGRCGTDEVNQPALGRPMSQPWQWPLGPSAITRRRNEIEKRFGAPQLYLIGPSGDGGAVVITGEGAAPLVVTPNSGWAKFGYDDGADRSEIGR